MNDQYEHLNSYFNDLIRLCKPECRVTFSEHVRKAGHNGTTESAPGLMLYHVSNGVQIVTFAISQRNRLDPDYGTLAYFKVADPNLPYLEVVNRILKQVEIHYG